MSRFKEKVAELIEEAFKKEGLDVFVDPKHLSSAQGFYRTSGGDFYCWEGQAQVKGTNANLSLQSYTTMTRILNSKGAQVIQDKRHASSYDVYDATGN
jgi:hypothetical protein